MSVPLLSESSPCTSSLVIKAQLQAKAVLFRSVRFYVDCTSHFAHSPDGAADLPTKCRDFINITQRSRFTSNLTRLKESSHWCGVEVRKLGFQLRYLLHLTKFKITWSVTCSPRVDQSM
ncbi:hypothetical protein TNCV_3672651 [Trichonephila clavipes]|nr:hypothetical protein TNCV_3672651 [Trichonephila clavipes]